MRGRRFVDPDVEPYVRDPAEAGPPPRLHGAVPALWAGLALLLVACVVVLVLRSGREDPAFTVPLPSAPGVEPSVPAPVAPAVPTAGG